MIRFSFPHRGGSVFVCVLASAAPCDICVLLCFALVSEGQVLPSLVMK